MNNTLPHFLAHIIPDDALHAKWLNTLSFMENCGAKKISRCQHPYLVTEIILKHAAEEARHGYYLKKQLAKLSTEALTTYEAKYLLAPSKSIRYLDQLDIQICKLLKKEYELSGERLKYGAYLLVTYAIEVRADDMYPIYQQFLTDFNSRVNVKSIIIEETEHLKEMESGIGIFFEHPVKIMEKVRTLEENLYNEWMVALNNALPIYN